MQLVIWIDDDLCTFFEKKVRKKAIWDMPACLCKPSSPRRERQRNPETILKSSRQRLSDPSASSLWKAELFVERKNARDFFSCSASPPPFGETKKSAKPDNQRSFTRFSFQLKNQKRAESLPFLWEYNICTKQFIKVSFAPSFFKEKGGAKQKGAENRPFFMTI